MGFAGGFESISFTELSDVINWLESHGWYLATIRVNTKNQEIEEFYNHFDETMYGLLNKPNIYSIFIFRNILGNKCNEEQLPDICYHIAPMVAKEKILTNGLTPKRRSRVEYHPERVYLFSNIKDEWKKLVTILKLAKKIHIEEVVIFFWLLILGN